MSTKYASVGSQTLCATENSVKILIIQEEALKLSVKEGKI
jgi:hypothetical protein